MTDAELVALNAKGFIPGPGESEPDFLRRVEATQVQPTLPREQWDWVRLQLKEIFGFAPYSLPVTYSNKDLAPWHGAACWIGEDRVPLLQLREGFRKGSYLGIYSREEILSHEAVHAARAAFDEPESEEFFAYATSTKRWRKALGPIIKRPWEVWPLILLLGVGLFWLPALFFATLWITIGFIRLIKQHIRLAKAARFTGFSPQTARSLLLRLTDREIYLLAKRQWPKTDGSLRWRLIQLVYLDTLLP